VSLHCVDDPNGRPGTHFPMISSSCWSNQSRVVRGHILAAYEHERSLVARICARPRGQAKLPALVTRHPMNAASTNSRRLPRDGWGHANG
jgi:hypothetical protein